MKENSKTIRVHNLIILDESGSMQSIYNAALSGANETIQTIRSAQEKYSDQEHRISFVTFNTSGDYFSSGVNVKTHLDDVPITEASDLEEKDYQPNACTPLYDAMGIALTHLEGQVEENDRVLVTIITDGYENSSREYSGKAIKEKVGKLREKGWTFVYIGANQDAVEVAKELDIMNSLNFQADADGTKAMFEQTNANVLCFYSKIVAGYAGSDENFFDD